MSYCIRFSLKYSIVIVFVSLHNLKLVFRLFSFFQLILSSFHHYIFRIFFLPIFEYNNKLLITLIHINIINVMF